LNWVELEAVDAHFEFAPREPAPIWVRADFFQHVSVHSLTHRCSLPNQQRVLRAIGLCPHRDQSVSDLRSVATNASLWPEKRV
jgi:hypothetical protein